MMNDRKGGVKKKERKVPVKINGSLPCKKMERM